MKATLKKFGIKLVIFIAILFVVDRGIGKLLEHYFLRIANTEAGRINYAINESKEDMIIFGSSRANHHYVPTVFEDSLHMSCFNAGVDGEFIIYHDCVLRCILKRNAPKVILLDVNPDEFSTTKHEEVYSELSSLLPFYNSHREIDSLVDMKSPMEKYKVWSDMYRYNSLISTIAINTLHRKEENSIHGYMPLSRRMTGPSPELDISTDTELDSTKVNVFKSFIREAQAAGCEIYIFVSPSYQHRNALPRTIIAASQICAEKHVPFYDYSTNKQFLGHPEYFSDASHLNDNGARLYSNLICKQLKKS